jgi:leucyl aminopeptidase
MFSSSINKLSQRAFVINQIVNSNYISNFSNHTNYLRPHLKTDNKANHIQELNIYKDNMFKSLNQDTELLKLIYLAEAKNYTRDIANTRANIANCDYMEQESLKVLKEVQDDINLKNKSYENANLEVSIEIIKGSKLLDEKMNLFHAVGKSAQTEPRLIILKYKGNQISDEISHCILGKGLTYDTGGLNLKPTGYMEEMFLDKHGACNAIATFKYLAKLDVKLNIICALAVAENSIDSKSYKPSDIIKSRKGFTVEIGNTDAEGRLCLVDALSYIQDKYKPGVIIDLATLTGACCVALVS